MVPTESRSTACRKVLSPTARLSESGTIVTEYTGSVPPDATTVTSRESLSGPLVATIQVAPCPVPNTKTDDRESPPRLSTTTESSTTATLSLRLAQPMTGFVSGFPVESQTCACSVILPPTPTVLGPV